MAVPARVVGHIQEFNLEVENITSDLEKLQLYFSIKKWSKCRQSLLMLVGPKVYGTLAPVLPQDKDYDSLLSSLM